MNYARAIRIARAVSGLQQKELAQKAKLTSSYISLVETGKRSPSIASLSKISRALEIPEHLLTLLAADSDDLDKVNPAEIESVARSLMRVLLESSDIDTL